MSKKIIAAMMAIVMCAGIASCSKSSGGDDSKSASSAAEKSEEKKTDVTTDDDTTAENDTADITDDSSKDEVLVSDENTLKTNHLTMKLIEPNIIYIDENNLESEPTEDEVKAAIDAIFAQYKAAEDKDEQAFIDSFNFGILVDPIATLSEAMFEYDNEKSDEEFRQYLTSTNQGTKYEVIDDVIGLLEKIGDPDINGQLADAMDKKDGTNLKELLKKLTDGVKPGAEAVKENLDNETIFNSKEDIKKMENLGDDATYGFYLEYCDRYNDELYMRMTFSVLAGDKEYDLGGAETWFVGDQHGVLLTNEASEYEIDGEMMNMSTKQIFEAMKTQMSGE
ncbi:hypothetical protein [Ruminococcus sp.]|uniref:hypothetical protein n=1 Tax=Ruminococcus sp. TaxID=41978 RepID=UPI00258D804D|nr:hypothetical protein [Ruminococcus sp.]MCR5022289.1 hypothetical protein [Ruminococcus sp.]